MRLRRRKCWQCEKDFSTRKYDERWCSDLCKLKFKAKECDYCDKPIGDKRIRKLQIYCDGICRMNYFNKGKKND